MEHKIFVALSGAVLVALWIVGCSLAAPSATTVPPKATVASPITAPTATTARSSAPAQPTAAPTTAAQPSANYDGEWKGNTSSHSPVSLIVENNQLTFFNLNHGGAAGTCQSIGHKLSV